MRLSRWKKLFHPPIWDWIQVEVTTRCNSKCAYCPRTIYGKSWPERDLPLEVFRRLIPDLPLARHVHLQGWGEPFFHPDLFQMASIVRRAGSKLGTTTNGTLMDERLASQVVEAGFHVVAFSLAGAGPKNDTIRRGAPLNRVLEGMQRLVEARKRARSELPEIHVAYTLLASAAHELERLPEILKGIPVSEVVVSTLDLVADPALEKEVVEPSDPELLESLESVGERLAAQGATLHHRLACPADHPPLPCTENVLRAVVVSSDGQAGPCVYTNLDVPQGHYWREGAPRPCTRLSFGNLGQRSLRAIWEDSAYVAFRHSFSEGPLFAQCHTCPKLYGS